MNITVLDDWQNTVRTLPSFQKVAGHNVTIWNDHTKDVDVLAKRLADTEALCLIRERTPIRAPLRFSRRAGPTNGARISMGLRGAGLPERASRRSQAAAIARIRKRRVSFPIDANASPAEWPR